MTSNAVSIKQIMTTEVLTVHPGDTMEQVHLVFRSSDIHHLPVVDEEGRVVGIISKSDYYSISNAFPLFRPDLRAAANDRLFKSLLVEDVMTRQVATLTPEDSISIAAGYFKENLFHAIPIVDKGGMLVGILTTFDLLNYFFNQEVFLPT
ncbi:MAG: CBS domain-containing protein [Saprospirales bacterium]|jgi:CBS domain-containing protein|nr:CBS domain-containing protein [Saprospirales bacterium]